MSDRPRRNRNRMGEKAKDFKGSILRLVDYLTVYHFQLILVLFFAVGSTVFTIIGPKILARATDTLAKGVAAKLNHSGGIDFQAIIRIIIFLIVIYLLSAFFNYVQHYITSGISQKAAYQLRQDIADKMHRLPLSYFDHHASGDILSRVTNDVDTIAQSLNQSLAQIVTSIVSVIGILVMMISISIPMTLIAVCVLPVSLLLISQVIKRSQKYYRLQQASLGAVDGHIEEIYGAHQVVQAFNGQADALETFDHYNQTLYESAWKSQLYGHLMMPVSAFVGNVGYVAICIAGGLFASQGSITIGDIQAFLQYVRNFNQPVSMLAQIVNLLQSTAAASERVFEFLDEEELCQETVTVSRDEVNEINGAVTFDHVHFGYNPDHIIIHDFNFHVHAGQKVAIVGPTGAGKTTIVKLLLRFYELNEGSIMIDGYDITQMSRSDLRSLFGMVLQDAWLYHGTILENLKFGQLNATDEMVEEACQNARVDHLIRSLPEGYQTVINEESSNISQGQRQLLTIARAFLKNPKILILDEATSSVDTRTELLIQQGMDELMKDRTSFIIAHRLSTIKDANTIIVMKDGDIVEIGDHQSLLKEDGFYKELYTAQFKGHKI